MDQSIRRQDQFCGIDIVKFIAALSVVGIHTAFPYQIGVFFRWAVPFFFIASSFLFFYKKKSFKVFAKRLLILYCVWFVLELPLVWQRFAGQGFLEFLRSLFFANTFYASWYLTALLEAMGLCVLLSRWMNNKLLLLIGILMYLAALSLGGLYGFMPHRLKDILLSIDRIVPITHSFVAGFIYVVLGKIVSDHFADREIKNSVINISLLAVAVAFILETMVLRPYCHYYNTFLSLPLLAAALLMFAIRFKTGLNPKVCSFLRKASILIYLIHPVIIHFLPAFSAGSTAVNLILRYASAVLISFALASAIFVGARKWKPLCYLY